MDAPRPFIKWVGGKTQLLPELLKRVPATYGGYFEPFLGGGALFFAAQPWNAPRKIVLADACRPLVQTYEGLQLDVEEVIAGLGELAKRHEADPEKCYREQRERDMREAYCVDVAIWFIYLNKTCFNGVWRVNASGRYNVPLGKFKSPPKILDAPNLRACAYALFGATIVHSEFLSTLAQVGKDDFVYCDPPYVPVSKTAAFTRYTAGGFTATQQQALCNALKLARTRGARVLASNADVPLVRNMYEGFALDAVTARRGINCVGTKRGAIGEVLIS